MLLTKGRPVRYAVCCMPVAVLAMTAAALTGALARAEAVTPPSTWAPLTTLTSGAASGAGYEYQLAALPGGGATAVWGYGSKLETSTRTAGGVWSATTTIATVDGMFLSNFQGTAPTLAVAPSGQLVVAWTDHWASASAIIEESTKAPGAAAWSAPMAVSATGADAAGPHLTFGANGTAAVAWQDDAGIEVAKRPAAAGLWTSPVLVSDVTKQSAYPVAETPRIAVAGNGDVVATWFAPNGDTEWLRGATWSAATAEWSTPTWISDDDAVDQSFLVAGTDDSVTAAWGGSAADLATWSEGTWSAPRQVFTATNIDSLTSDSTGGMTATGVDDSRHVVVSSETNTGTWSAVTVVGGGDSATAGTSQAVSTSDGGITVVWNAFVNNEFELQDASLPVDGSKWTTPARVAPATTDAEDFAVVEGPDAALDVLIDDQTRRPSSDGGWLLHADSTTLAQLLSTRAPTVTGTPGVGHLLTAHVGTWSSTPQTYGYVWRRNGVAISGAIHSTFAPVLADAGTRISVTITARRASYRNGSAISASVPIPHPRILKSVSPSISGKARVGRVLSASAGRWSPTSTHIAFQWLRSGHAIRGGDRSTYRLSHADLHHALRVRVTVTRSGYVPAAATSRSVHVNN